MRLHLRLRLWLCTFQVKGKDKPKHTREQYQLVKSDKRDTPVEDVGESEKYIEIKGGWGRGAEKNCNLTCTCEQVRKEIQDTDTSIYEYRNGSLW